MNPTDPLASPAGNAAPTRVDFGYAFATPHRITVARPNSGDKTLLDAQNGSLRVAWTYDDLTRFPLMAFATPTTAWELKLQPEIDGHPFARSTWRRLAGYLPALDNEYQDGRGSARLEVAGAESAAIVRISLANQGDRPHTFAVRCERPGGFTGYNPAWVDPADHADVLLAGWTDRADRVVALATGADHCTAPHTTTVLMQWTLQPGECRTAWLIRPYRAYAAELPALRRKDWAAEFDAALAEWQALLQRACRVSIPDPGVQNAFYAGLADLFVMREPVAGGYIAGEPGTEGYRAPNSYEAGIMAIALDQCNLPDEAELGYRVCLDMQEADGNWTEPKGWAHLMWGGAGFKCWVILEHYRLTGDRDYLAAQFPRMAASSRWQEQQRRRTRIAGPGGGRPLTYGLMPKGMGDCGLKDGDDLYGVFIPHNIWAVFADRCAADAARILGKADEARELDRIYQVALDDLLRAMEQGAIIEDDPASGGGSYKWIPGVPGKTSGSRWGVLNALFPCGLLPPDHPLIDGTLRKIESHLSPGGIPVNTGWMTDGMWVAITLDNIAEAHLARGNGDAAAEYVYATLNHGTPLYSWCEERGQQPGADKTSGDRQHLWTPVAVVRALRDGLVMEHDDGLELALGTSRAWLAGGQPISIAGAPTRFGTLAYRVQFDAAAGRITGSVAFPGRGGLAWVRLHVRLPGARRMAGVDAGCGAVITAGGTALQWTKPHGEVTFEAHLD